MRCFGSISGFNGSNRCGGALIDRLGFFGIDPGSLAMGGRLVQFPGGPLLVLNLVRIG